MNDTASPPAVQTRTSRILRAVAFPALVVLVLILLGLSLGWSYTGAMRWLGEVQFRLLNRWHPALSVLLLAAIFAILWRIAVFAWRRKRTDHSDPLDVRRRLITYYRALTFLFAGSAILAVLLALAAVFHLMTLPGDEGPARTIAPDSGSTLVEGPVVMEGWRTIGPLARYEEGLLGIGPNLWLVPVASRSSSLGREYTLFVEVPDRRHPIIADRHSGILRRDALPPEVAMLYRLNGMRVMPEAGVVFLNSTSVQRGALFFLFESLVAALIALGFTAYGRRRVSKLRDELSEIAPTSANGP